MDLLEVASWQGIYLEPDFHPFVYGWLSIGWWLLTFSNRKLVFKLKRPKNKLFRVPGIYQVRGLKWNLFRFVHSWFDVFRMKFYREYGLRIRFVLKGSFLGGWNFRTSLPSRKLRWQWKIHHLKMYFLLKMGIFQCHVSFQGSTPPKFNSSPLKNDGWEMILSFWVSAYLQGRHVKLQECSTSIISWGRLVEIFLQASST